MIFTYFYIVNPKKTRKSIGNGIASTMVRTIFRAPAPPSVVAVPDSGSDEHQANVSR